MEFTVVRNGNDIMNNSVITHGEDMGAVPDAEEHDVGGEEQRAEPERGRRLHVGRCKVTRYSLIEQSPKNKSRQWTNQPCCWQIVFLEDVQSKLNRGEKPTYLA